MCLSAARAVAVVYSYISRREVFDVRLGCVVGEVFLQD